MGAGKFERDKLMAIMGASRRRKRFVTNGVVARISRLVTSLAGDADFATAFQVQTKLQTPRMKRASPVKRARQPEIVPFHGHACSIDVAVERMPTPFHLAPGTLFGGTTGIHCP